MLMKMGIKDTVLGLHLQSPAQIRRRIKRTIGTGCPGKCSRTSHPWRCSRTVQMWHMGTWSVGMVRMGWGWGSGSSFPTSTILWFYKGEEINTHCLLMVAGSIFRWDWVFTERGARFIIIFMMMTTTNCSDHLLFAQQLRAGCSVLHKHCTNKTEGKEQPVSKHTLKINSGRKQRLPGLHRWGTEILCASPWAM